MPLDLDKGPRFLFLPRVPQILRGHFAECTGRLGPGLSLLGPRVLVIGEEAKQPFRFFSCLVGRPGGAVRANGDEPLLSAEPILYEIGRNAALTPSAKAFDRLPMTIVPHRLARAQFLHSPNRHRHNLSPLI